ncbi:Lipoprotein OS=Ureibacillus acetophenoni OX=614649 GN=SAMN05877842_105143 PE=4 SV=1 [Ureibacillus acetophenoni]
MKKLLSFLLVFTLASVLSACNILPQLNGPANNDGPQVNNNSDNNNTNSNNDNNNNNNNQNNNNNTNNNNQNNNNNNANNNNQNNNNNNFNNNNNQNNNTNTNSGNDDLAIAFQAYIDEISALAPEEGRIIAAYSNVSGVNYVDDATMYEALYYDVVPSYTEFVRALSEIRSDNQIINDLHALYVEGATIQLGAFAVMIAALEDQSRELVETANQGLNEASTLIKEWQAQLQVLSVQTGVSF